MQISDPRRLLVAVVKVLNKCKIPYIITGGIAVLVWGRPRFTADIDIVVELRKEQSEGLRTALLSLGQAGYIDDEAMAQALASGGEFNFIHGESGVKVDFWIMKEKDGFDSDRFKRKKAKYVLDEKIYFTSPEDLILIKLKWYKESKSSRQLEDVESILKISGDKLDFAYLKGWAKQFDVLSVFQSLKSDKCFCGSGKKYKECCGK